MYIYNKFSLSSIFYELNSTCLPEDYLGNSCLKITVIEFFIFLIFSILPICFFILGQLKLKNDFFNDFMDFFKTCEMVSINEEFFEVVNYYIDKSFLLILIGFSRKISINIIFLGYVLYKYKNKIVVNYKSVDIIFFLL